MDELDEDDRNDMVALAAIEAEAEAERQRERQRELTSEAFGVSVWNRCLAKAKEAGLRASISEAYLKSLASQNWTISRLSETHCRIVSECARFHLTVAKNRLIIVAAKGRNIAKGRRSVGLTVYAANTIVRLRPSFASIFEKRRLIIKDIVDRGYGEFCGVHLRCTETDELFYLASNHVAIHNNMTRRDEGSE